MSWLLINSQWEVGSGLSYSWSIHGNAQGDLPYSWRIEENVSGPLAYSWSIGGYVENTLSYSWNVLRDIAQGLPYSWAINVFFGTSRPQHTFYSEEINTEFMTGETRQADNDFKRARFK